MNTRRESAHRNREMSPDDQRLMSFVSITIKEERRSVAFPLLGSYLQIYSMLERKV